MDASYWSENATQPWPVGDVLVSNPAGETQCIPESASGSTGKPAFMLASVSTLLPISSVSSSSIHTHEQWRQTGVTQAYLAAIGNAKFCAVPAGIVGWSFRLSEVIYSGCIPVFIGTTTRHPFYDMIDYRKLSVSISLDDFNAGLLESKLRSISVDQGKKLQATALATRGFFTYDEQEDLRTSDGVARGPVGLLLRALSKRKLAKKKQQQRASDALE
jgi:hypothetical protein